MVLNATACLFAGNIITGNVGTADEVPIGNMTWSSGTVTVTTARPHNLTIGADVAASIENTPAATHFTYTGVANNPGAFAGGNWNRGLQYAIMVRSATQCVFAGNDVRLHASGVEVVKAWICIWMGTIFVLTIHS